jgi:hypothetical protein
MIGTHAWRGIVREKGRGHSRRANRNGESQSALIFCRIVRR